MTDEQKIILTPEVAKKALKMQDEMPAGILEMEEKNRRAFDNFTAFIAAHNHSSDELLKASAKIVPRSNPSGDAIPGKMPSVTIGKLAIKAAWQIEGETGKRATAKQVIEKLQSWVDHKDNTEAVAELIDKIPNGVKWVTSAGKENSYDIGACQKTLETWKKSRA